MNPSIRQRRKQRVQDGVWKVHDRAHLLFITRTLCMSYVIVMFLLVSCINTRNILLYFARFCALSTPKIAKKNTATFVRIINNLKKVEKRTVQQE